MPVRNCECPENVKRPVMVEVMGEYDGGLYFECATCHARWHRWTEDQWVHRRAEPYVNNPPEYPAPMRPV